MIEKIISLPIPPQEAFDSFWQHLNEWWPTAYTWSQDQLEEIRMDGKLGGFCTEIGPQGFRIDWGRIIKWNPGERLTFLWQISPKREPVPNPAAASKVTLHFVVQPGGSDLTLLHEEIENHGEGAQGFEDVMAGPYGWDFILEEFKNWVTSNR